jgi:TetR/AcrR family transcriptional regulator
VSDTPERILEAAEAVLVRKGVDGARTREIADAAGVNPALIHYYFGTKAELSRMVFRRVVRRSVAPVVRAWSVPDPLEVNVARSVRACTDAFRSHRDVPGFLLSTLHREPTLASELIHCLSVDREGTSPPGREAVGRLAAQLKRHGTHADGPAISAVQLLTNLLALCLFPFAVRPALQAGLGMGDEGFDRFLDRHVQQVSELILRGLDSSSSADPSRSCGQ